MHITITETDSQLILTPDNAGVKSLLLKFAMILLAGILLMYFFEESRPVIGILGVQYWFIYLPI